MKNLSFWQSLERYAWRLAERVGRPLPYLGAVLWGAVVVASILTLKTSLASTRSLREASLRAAGVGDYDSAQALWNVHQVQTANQQMIMGAESEVEDLIYPQRIVEREIEKYERLLEQYPGHRDIYLTLAELYQELDPEQASSYLERASQLDPNNEVFNSQSSN